MANGRDLKGWLALRWFILERDNFACQYCGQYAPNVLLEVDHKMAICEGGGNGPDNLITACWACNRGKENLRVINTKLPYPFNISVVARPRRGQLRTRVIGTLQEQGPMTATMLAIATGFNRTAISTLLTHDPAFAKCAKEGHNQPYGLQG